MSETSKVKDSRIDLRVTQEQKEFLEKAASLRGISLSAYTPFRRNRQKFSPYHPTSPNICQDLEQKIRVCSHSLIKSCNF